MVPQLVCTGTKTPYAMDTHSARQRKTEENSMAREGGKDRGLFRRSGQPDWWIRWTCPYGHDHREKIGPKSLARQIYQQRKVAVKTENFCLTQERDRH